MSIYIHVPTAQIVLEQITYKHPFVGFNFCHALHIRCASIYLYLSINILDS